MSQAISLKFELAADRSADLEIISEAAIAWVEALRAAAQAVDEKTDVRVRLVNVERRSALFNVLGEWFDRAADKWEAAPRRAKLIRALTIFTIVSGYPTYQAYFGDGFGEEERKQLDRIEAACQKDPAVTAARQKFFRVIEREPAVTAVSLKAHPDAEPYATIPSTEFAEAGGLFMPEEELPSERVGRTVMEVVLVKPALVAKPRNWTFKLEGFGEFDAVMRDPVVLQTVGSNGLDGMKEGMRMTVRIETREVLSNGKWRPSRNGRSIIRVISPKLN
ncbi:hypothetical protein [Croceicoccus sp. BE223]|uniref:hypothetical protein n=1 Tax=Croceicoccus sp. BE223 TaxID=2817716 RepID=UPI00285E4B36|nr:hypothetical protein [Croceicoccus sp. BE223]MDR7103046.1 hypothetical protein [Croceicoccus sp. BE223]